MVSNAMRITVSTDWLYSRPGVAAAQHLSAWLLLAVQCALEGTSIVPDPLPLWAPEGTEEAIVPLVMGGLLAPVAGGWTLLNVEIIREGGAASAAAAAAARTARARAAANARWSARRAQLHKGEGACTLQVPRAPRDERARSQEESEPSLTKNPNNSNDIGGCSPASSLSLIPETLTHAREDRRHARVDRVALPGPPEPVPADLAPTAETLAACAMAGWPDPTPEMAVMIATHQSSGKLSCDWQAEIRRWASRQAQFSRRRPEPWKQGVEAKGERKLTTDEFHAAWAEPWRPASER